MLLLMSHSNTADTIAQHLSSKFSKIQSELHSKCMEHLIAIYIELLTAKGCFMPTCRLYAIGWHYFCWEMEVKLLYSPKVLRVI